MALSTALVIGVVIELVMGNKNLPGQDNSGHTHQGRNRQQDGQLLAPLTTGYTPYIGLDPIRDMEIDMLDIRLDAAPDRKYYNLVMGVYNAVQKGLLIPVRRTYDIGEKFIETELYKDSGKEFHEIRLPSAKAITSARHFFDKEMKAEREKRLEEERKKKGYNRQPINYVKISKSYGSDRKCHLYKGLLNNMFPVHYVENPIRDLQIHYLKINLDAKPDDNYYILVLKVNDAVQRGILTPKPRTWDLGEKFIETQIYKYSNDNRELRLVSHKALAQAISYIKRKIEAECESSSEEYSSSDSQEATSSSEETSDDSSGNSSSHEDTNEKTTSHTVKVHMNAAVHQSPDDDLPNNSHKCDTREAVTQLRRSMHEIDFDSKPNSIYFKLVLRVNRAVQCHILVAIKDTVQTGLNGVHTQFYRVTADHTRVRLVSVTDKSRAKAFFHDRHPAIRKIHDDSGVTSSTKLLDLHR